jgi:hypothetical protein
MKMVGTQVWSNEYGWGVIVLETENYFLCKGARISKFKTFEF